jgi:NitT/TauT family transport system permease protein
MRDYGRYLNVVFLGIGVLVVWQLIIYGASVPQYILPGPVAIARDIASSPLLLTKQLLVTTGEAVLGFLIANLGAILVAVLIVFTPGLDRAVMPFAIALKTTPIVAMAPLLLLWFGTGIAPKVVAACLICFFPALVNSVKGLHALQEGDAELFTVYGASKLQILWKLRFPRAAPFIFSALKISSSLAIVGAIIGEFVGANQGIGYEILVSSYHLTTVRMFSALVFTALAGILLYGVIAYCEDRIVFWLESPVDDARLDSPRRATRQASSRKAATA